MLGIRNFINYAIDSPAFEKILIIGDIHTEKG